MSILASTRPRTRGLPRLATVVVAALAVVAALVPVTTLTTPPAEAASGARKVSSSFDQQVLHWTNVERKKRGLRPLRMTECVKRFAYRHTKRMAARDRLYHQQLRPVMRKCDARRAAENVAWGPSGMSARSVVKRWMKSSGHRRNILARQHGRIGIDAWRSTDTGRVYVAQVFRG